MQKFPDDASFSSSSGEAKQNKKNGSKNLFIWVFYNIYYGSIKREKPNCHTARTFCLSGDDKTKSCIQLTVNTEAIYTCQKKKKKESGHCAHSADTPRESWVMVFTFRCCFLGLASGGTTAPKLLRFSTWLSFVCKQTQLQRRKSS